MLLEMLKNHTFFQDLDHDQKEIMARLAVAFEQDNQNIFRSPDELARYTSIGNRYQWASFLSLEPVQRYIRSQIAQSLQVMQRKTLLALQQEAEQGNVQAIRQIQELSGIMEKSDNNKIIVLHYVPRPKTVRQEEVIGANGAFQEGEENG